MSIRKKRTKLDLYASILEVMGTFDDGARITKISYGVGMPVDRLRVFLEDLGQYGFVSKTTSESQEVFYSVTQRGQRYLKTYWQLVGLLQPIDTADTND
jgi:predicted transcriptional regulator